MTATLPTTPPTAAVAGDTWAFTDTSPDYPASDGWVLAVRIAGPVILPWSSGWASVSDGMTTVTIPASSTAPLKAGRYEVTKEYTLSGERHSVACDPLVVAPNPATLKAGDTLARAEIELEQVNCAIDAVLAGKAVQYYQIGNRQVGNTPLKDLMAIRDGLEIKVTTLRQSPSTGFGRPIRYRYVSTSP